ncbi:MAG: hypothetical protein HY343_08390 [Lentisphaerae bacterium]|nr:hypothetical protein [Lentisphaerota bacterium]
MKALYQAGLNLSADRHAQEGGRVPVPPEKRFLAGYNVVWTAQSKHCGESMPCGGGDIGLNVWVENGELLLYLSRSGAFDENNLFPKLGRIRVALSPNPLGEGASFRQELKLNEGCIEILGAKEGLHARIDVWVDVFRPAVHIEIAASEPVTVDAAYENWRLTDHELNEDECDACRTFKQAPVPAVVHPDVVAFSQNQVLFHHRNRNTLAFDLCVEQQELNSVRNKLWNPLEGLTFGGTFYGEGMAAAGTTEGKYADTEFKAWHLKSKKPAREQKLVAALHVANTATAEAWREELETIVKDVAAHAATARQRTEEWWRQFWARSYIFVNADKPDPASPVWQIGRNYQIFRYQLGCNAYGGYPTKFNGGLFTFDPVYVDTRKPYSPDHRQWGGGSFTAQNQRLVYWPMLKSGDFDMLKPQFEFYRRALVNAETRSEVYWGIKGASFTEQIENFGLPVGFEYGWKRRPDFEKGVEDNAWLEYYWDTVFEICQMILDSRLYADADIRDYLPLIESCLAFFDEYYRLHAKRHNGKPLSEDGKLVLFPGSSLETYKGNVLNATPTLCALRSILRNIMELPEELLPDSRREHWRTLLVRIPDIAFRDMEGHKTISPAWQWDRIQNVDLPQLYPVYPWNFYGIGRPALEVAIDTWKYGADRTDQKQIVSWHQDAIFCARLGLTEEAATLTVQKMRDSDRRFPTWWGPGHDWVPDHNWGGSGMIGMQEMLMQTDGKKIYLLPAWPKDWNVVFKLHAPYNTVVEAVVKEGKVAHLKVTPKSRAKDVVQGMTSSS